MASGIYFNRSQESEIRLFRERFPTVPRIAPPEEGREDFLDLVGPKISGDDLEMVQEAFKIAISTCRRVAPFTSESDCRQLYLVDHQLNQCNVLMLNDKGLVRKDLYRGIAISRTKESYVRDNTGYAFLKSAVKDRAFSSLSDEEQSIGLYYFAHELTDSIENPDQVLGEPWLKPAQRAELKLDLALVYQAKEKTASLAMKYFKQVLKDPNSTEIQREQARQRMPKGVCIIQ